MTAPSDNRATVAVLKTGPQTVLETYRDAMHHVHYQQEISAEIPTLVKLNLSWTRYFPACSSQPWQVEGVIKTLLADGYQPDRLLPIENKTVVTHPVQGARNNRWLGVLERHGLPFIPLTEVEWVRYEFKSPLLKLDQIFPEGIEIPEMFAGKNVHMGGKGKQGIGIDHHRFFETF